MSEETMSAIREEIRKTIKETVNGKIDKINEIIEVHNTSHELDMIMVRKHIDESNKSSALLLEKIKPITELYDGLGTSRRFIIGVSTTILALGAVGAGITWLVNAVIQK